MKGALSALVRVLRGAVLRGAVKRWEAGVEAEGARRGGLAWGLAAWRRRVRAGVQWQATAAAAHAATLCALATLHARRGVAALQKATALRAAGAATRAATLCARAAHALHTLRISARARGGVWSALLARARAHPAHHGAVALRRSFCALRAHAAGRAARGALAEGVRSGRAARECGRVLRALWAHALARKLWRGRVEGGREALEGGRITRAVRAWRGAIAASRWARVQAAAGAAAWARHALGRFVGAVGAAGEWRRRAATAAAVARAHHCTRLSARVLVAWRGAAARGRVEGALVRALGGGLRAVALRGALGRWWRGVEAARQEAAERAAREAAEAAARAAALAAQRGGALAALLPRLTLRTTLRPWRRLACCALRKLPMQSTAPALPLHAGRRQRGLHWRGAAWLPMLRVLVSCAALLPVEPTLPPVLRAPALPCVQLSVQAQ